MYLGAGALLAIDYWLVVLRPMRADCEPGRLCHVDSRTMRLSRYAFWTAVGIYVCAVAVGYGALLWLRLQG